MVRARVVARRGPLPVSDGDCVDLLRMSDGAVCGLAGLLVFITDDLDEHAFLERLLHFGSERFERHHGAPIWSLSRFTLLCHRKGADSTALGGGVVRQRGSVPSLPDKETRGCLSCRGSGSDP